MLARPRSLFRDPWHQSPYLVPTQHAPRPVVPRHTGTCSHRTWACRTQKDHPCPQTTNSASVPSASICDWQEHPSFLPRPTPSPPASCWASSCEGQPQAVLKDEKPRQWSIWEGLGGPEGPASGALGWDPFLWGEIAGFPQDAFEQAQQCLDAYKIRQAFRQHSTLRLLLLSNVANPKKIYF